MTTVTIIETGVVPPSLRDAHGSYPDMFARALGGGPEDLSFCSVGAEACAYPDLADIEAVLITGSPAGVYDDLPWIAPLEAFVRRVHAARIPMVGVCFGHQLIAQALGGVVRKSDKGWGIGRHVYAVAPGTALLPATELAIACSHQDQVVRPPDDATVLLSSDFTPYAGLLFTNGTTLSVQAHPEFTPNYAAALCHLRSTQLPADKVDVAVASLDLHLDSGTLNRAIGRLLSGKPQG